MKITFPHMGITYIPIKAILDELDIDCILPPKSNKRTLEIGVKHSPEGICVPFKVIIGNIIEGIEKGADTVFMLTGCGPCRFGVFHLLQKEIITDLGYDVEFLTADRFSSLSGLREFASRLKQASPKNTYLKIFITIRKAIKVLEKVDHLYELTNRKRCIEAKKGSVDNLINEFEDKVRVVFGANEIINLLEEYTSKVTNIEVKERDCLKVGIVGEIYTVLENYINQNIEKKLGSMGIDVYRSISTSEFVREQLDFLPFVHSNRKETYKYASSYLKTPIGGHAINTIGDTMKFKEHGFDGVIHLLPFTCMPEIVSQSILPVIEKEQNIPIMTLVLDEMTGDAGFITRLEAFQDLLIQRREAY